MTRQTAVPVKWSSRRGARAAPSLSEPYKQISHIRLFSSHSRSRLDTKRIKSVDNANRWPSHPGERSSKLRPCVAAFLTLSVQPFKQHPLYLVSEGSTPPRVVRDGVIVEVAHQPQLSRLQQCPFSEYASFLPQPDVHLFHPAGRDSSARSDA